MKKSLFSSMVFFAVFALMMMFTGCASWSNRPTVCDSMPPGESLLCEIATEHNIRLEDVGNGLIIINAIAIAEGAYSKKDAARVLNRLYTALDESITYALFKDKLLEYTKTYPGLIDVVQIYLDDFALPTLMKRVDRNMLKTWIQARLKTLE